jgi:hypothetical protein
MIPISPDDADGSHLASYRAAYRTELAPSPGTRLLLVRLLAGGPRYRIHRP